MVKASHAVWCRGLTEEARTALQPADAAARLATGSFVNIDCEPKFKISPGAKWFAIGSCFAINLTRALVKSGFPVLSARVDHPSGLPLLSKYNTYSMSTELAVALEGRRLIDDGLVELSEGRFWDPQLHHAPIGPRDELMKLRELVTEYFRRIVEADVCVLTLGLTEMFWDLRTDVPLNTGPVDWRHAHQTKRFEFRNPGYAEILANVEEICAMVRRATNNQCKIILTVSPVPLQRTFSNDDIIVANHYSKSLLRTVASAVRDKLDYVDYYPAYEIVTYSPRAITWEHDQRHVTQAVVDHVISLFRQKFVDSGQLGV